MSTAIAILGGVGLFLLGMTVMTDGLKALAGSALRTVLGKAAATPLSGAFWGAIVTLLVQSSSATTMTTIGLVSAGLLTFPQGLGLVFGANVGTTGTGWLVALIGVRVSLSSYALPLIFVGALTKLLGGGRIAAAGGALAGFALVLYGLTTLQQGMGGLAERMHPSDLPAVLGAVDVGWVRGWIGLLTLALIGLVMTAVMQSSTAAIAVTLSAFYAGAIGLDQGCALIIGQNVGTATSSALAAIGASATAKRLALAYVLFKVIAAIIALVAFPFTMPLIRHWSGTIDGVTLLAAYHTAFNVVGVAVLMPAIGWFTRFVERLMPVREAALTRALDPAALLNPIVAVEAARRTVAGALELLCGSIAASLSGERVSATARVAEVKGALHKVQEFLSEITASPESDEEHQRLTGTLHALEHASRLAEITGEEPPLAPPEDSPLDSAGTALCIGAMRSAIAAVHGIADEAALSDVAAPIAWQIEPDAASALDKLESAAAELKDRQRAYRSATLAAVAPGKLTADEAFARVDAMRRLEALTRHAWRASAHLAGRAEELDRKELERRP
jgi:phosphate:Na+ symporter